MKFYFCSSYNINHIEASETLLLIHWTVLTYKSAVYFPEQKGSLNCFWNWLLCLMHLTKVVFHYLFMSMCFIIYFSFHKTWNQIVWLFWNTNSIKAKGKITKMDILYMSNPKNIFFNSLNPKYDTPLSNFVLSLSTPKTRFNGNKLY